MRLITCHGGRIWETAAEMPAFRPPSFFSSLPAIDALLPNGIQRAAVHEILSPAGRAATFAMLLARASRHFADEDRGVVVWCDPNRTAYAPALASAGIPLDQLYLL